MQTISDFPICLAGMTHGLTGFARAQAYLSARTRLIEWNDGRHNTEDTLQVARIAVWLEAQARLTAQDARL